MARFRAFIRGWHGSAAARLGDEASGVYAEVTATSVGASLQAHVVDGADVVDVWVSRGREAAPRYIGRVQLTDGRPAFVPVER